MATMSQELVWEPHGVCPACGDTRQAEWLWLTSGGVVLSKRGPHKFWCANGCTASEIEAAEQRQLR